MTNSEKHREYTPAEWLAAAVDSHPAELASPYDLADTDAEDRDEDRRRRALAHELHLAVRSIRQRAIGTQTDAAKAWHRPQSQVSRLESDPSASKVGTFLDYLSALNVSMSIRLSTGDITVELRSVDGRLVPSEAVTQHG